MAIDVQILTIHLNVTSIFILVLDQELLCEEIVRLFTNHSESGLIIILHQNDLRFANCHRALQDFTRVLLKLVILQKCDLEHLLTVLFPRE
jgi:hypothetical protein